MDPFLSAIFLFCGNFPMRGFASCDGQILPLSQNTALFSLLGTNYGGNGQSTFALPDLRGRVGIQQGQGPGLSNYVLGEQAGVESVTMSYSQMPAHRHLVNAVSSAGNSGTPSGTVLGRGPSSGAGPQAVIEKFYNTSVPNVQLAGQTITATGGNQPFSVLQPPLALNFLFALQGVFPARN